MRAAAVSSLARFGAAVAELHPRIVVLLRRALFDNDDEARVNAVLRCRRAASAWLGLVVNPRRPALLLHWYVMDTSKHVEERM